MNWGQFRDQAAGGGRFWIGCSAGLFGGRWTAFVETTRRSNPKLNAATSDGGTAAASGRWVGTRRSWWSRRWHVTASAGFCNDHRSSLTEITGNRMTTSMTSATLETRGLVVARGRCLNQRYKPQTVTRAQTKLRSGSIPSDDSIPAMMNSASTQHVSKARYRLFTRQQPVRLRPRSLRGSISHNPGASPTVRVDNKCSRRPADTRPNRHRRHKSWSRPQKAACA